MHHAVPAELPTGQRATSPAAASAESNTPRQQGRAGPARSKHNMPHQRMPTAVPAIPPRGSRVGVPPPKPLIRSRATPCPSTSRISQVTNSSQVNRGSRVHAPLPHFRSSPTIQSGSRATRIGNSTTCKGPPHKSPDVKTSKSSKARTPSSTEQPGIVNRADYNSLKVSELKILLKARNLKVSGLKEELISRLQSHDDPVVVDEDYLLSLGLSYFNFDENRLSRVKKETNIDRWKNYFGIPPRTALAVYEDLKRETGVNLVYFLMTLHWFTKYGTEKDLIGPWGFCEDHVRDKCKEYAKMIQSLKEKKIVFGGFDESEIHWITVDTVNFLTQEFRLDPSVRELSVLNHAPLLINKLITLPRSGQMVRSQKQQQWPQV